MNYTYHEKKLYFKRWPKTSNRTLQAWNAADEHLLRVIDEDKPKSETMILYNDRFGFLSTVLHERRPYTVLEFKSQEKACRFNFNRNEVVFSNDHFLDPLSALPEMLDLVLIQIPKSLELFRFYLEQISQALSPDGVVYCGFMTRHFSKQILETAAFFFDRVEQNKAWKKSRILILGNRKKVAPADPIKSIPLNSEKTFQQYPGVFSSDHIDYASQFLLEHLDLATDEKRVLDLASGNGVLAWAIQQQQPRARIHLLDDSFLAIESSRLNIEGKKVVFHYDDTLDALSDASLDIIVSNPPFHFGYETNIEVAVSLFKQTRRCLKPRGRFVLVANQHLNYRTHLERIYKQVVTTAQNDKYIIYTCK